MSEYFIGIRVDDVLTPDESTDLVGHAMITFTDASGETSVWGYMPDGDKQQVGQQRVGKIIDQSDHGWNFEKRVPVSLEQFSAAISFMLETMARTDLLYFELGSELPSLTDPLGSRTFNCVSFVDRCFSEAGIIVSPTFTYAGFPSPATIQRLDFEYSIARLIAGIEY